jgi:ABC-2 type transport system ATP-binding protein
MSAFACAEVTKRYGDVLALEECSIEISSTGFHCLVGPNGSGKTTLLRLLLGLEHPTTGAVTRSAVSVGAGFQRPSFYPTLSVRENLDVFARVNDGAHEAWRERLLDELRLRSALDRPAGDLSGGFSRKLDLALALQRRPAVVLLDEPLGALDDVAQARLVEFLEAYATDDHAVVVSTHRLGRFEGVVDRLTVLHDGAVRFDGAIPTLDLDQSLRSWYVDMGLAADEP